MTEQPGNGYPFPDDLHATWERRRINRRTRYAN